MQFAADFVDRLVIRWPSGLQQEVNDIPAGQHIVITEGSPMIEKVTPGQLIKP